VKQIAKTSNLIRKKNRTLKTNKIDENIALEKHFKPIVESLKQIVENTANDESQPIKKEVNVVKDKNIKKRKPENNDSDDFWMNNSLLQLTPSSKKQYKRIECRIPIMRRIMNNANYRTHISSVEDIYETPIELLETLVKQLLQTRQVCEELHNQLGALGQKYVNYMLLDGWTEKDHVYIYLSENGTMLGDKQFNVDTSDFVIVDD